MSTAKRPCPICSNDDIKVLHVQRFVLPDGHPLPDGYTVVTCNNCGFVYADTAVSQDIYDRYYSQFSKYEDKKTGTGGVENQWDHDRVKKTASEIASFLDNRNASILDVGCANGGLLKGMLDLGYSNILGIDPSPACVLNTRELGVNAQIGSLNHPLDLDNEGFDCVILSHTLEHVQDLKLAAAWISKVMSEEGVVYIEVPDASRYKDFIDAPLQDFNTEHINHFSLASLKNYLMINGFTPIAWGEKIIPASADKPYPAIYCYGKKDKTINNIEIDTALSKDIITYIQRSQDILNAFDVRLQTVLPENKSVLVWGVGQLAMKLLGETALANTTIIAFVDSNPINQGKTIRGVKVVSPDEIVDFPEPILITSTLHQQSIVEQIHNMGLKNQLILLKDE